MAVYKLARSGNSVLFITDDRIVYVVPVKLLESLLNKRSKYVVPYRLPYAVENTNYPISPVYDSAKPYVNEKDKVIEDVNVW